MCRFNRGANGRFQHMAGHPNAYFGNRPRSLDPGTNMFDNRSINKYNWTSKKGLRTDNVDHHLASTEIEGLWTD
jgi:hypothetical protein